MVVVLLNEGLLAAKAGQQREIHVDGLARLAPALQGRPADEPETPLLRLTDGLKLSGGSDDFHHVPLPS